LQREHQMIKYYRQVELLTLKGRTQYRVMKGTPSKSEYETGKTYLLTWNGEHSTKPWIENTKYI